MEVEAEVGRDVLVGRLLERQHDVEADAVRTDVVSTPVRGLHDRPARRR